MRHTHFEIENYRGIKKLRLDLLPSPRTNVFTLVGLNESGKTTILEAINLFSYRTDLDPLDLPGYSVRDVHDLIPISQRSNFNGTIRIVAGFECDIEDERALAKHCRETLGFSLAEKVKRFEIEQAYEFKNSVIIPGQPENIWEINLVGRKPGARKSRSIDASTTEWQKATDFLAERLPSVLYFPNFLFELPDRIYLEPSGADEKKHELYRKVLQDILDAIGEKTNLQDHVLARAKSTSNADRQALESVLLKMGSHITQTVFSSWDRIFKRRPGRKEIVVSIGADDAGRSFVQLRLKEGSNLYSISERSLGFRWFFTFLLLTQYRGSRTVGPRGVLFLFDEPASNLHPSAQSQLLESFGRFPTHAPIVYTTHSHHMVNPEWLEGTFVVKNEAIDYEEVDEFTDRPTEVALHRYRTFAAEHPHQSTYFQPVLDVLDYQPSKLENVPALLMAEGKNDFYSLRYLQFLTGHNDVKFILPGTGAGTLAAPVQLYLGWGRKFVVLLDSDGEGNTQQQRYETLFGSLVAGKILTLEGIHSEWKGLGMEGLFGEEDRMSIQRSIFPQEDSYKKKLFNQAIQELLLARIRVDLSAATIDRFNRIFSLVGKMLGAAA